MSSKTALNVITKKEITKLKKDILSLKKNVDEYKAVKKADWKDFKNKTKAAVKILEHTVDELMIRIKKKDITMPDKNKLTN